MTSRDLVVVGAGPAGLWCATEARARGLATTIVEALSFGGQLVNIAEIADVPGVEPGTAGWDLAAMLVDAAQDSGAEMLMIEVEHIEEIDGLWRVTGRDLSINAGAVVIATGTREHPLRVPGAQALVGRGVSSCAACDGPLFAGRAVAVLGGNDIAVHEARSLAGIAASVTVLAPEGATTVRSDSVDAVARLANVRLVPGAVLLEIIGEQTVERVRYADAAGEHAIEIDAVFNALDRDPTAPATQPTVALDDEGAVIVTADLSASEGGLFAAGDTRFGSGRDIASARDDGQRAAAAVASYLEHRTRASGGA